jgi:hypothetical protein
MTKDEIILIADASGLSYYGMGKDREKFIHYLEAFAALVAAAEREACAKVCEAKRIVKGGEVFAAAIRARGNT